MAEDCREHEPALWRNRKNPGCHLCADEQELGGIVAAKACLINRKWAEIKRDSAVRTAGGSGLIRRIWYHSFERE